MSDPVRLTPEHGRLIDAAVRALAAEYRRAGLRGLAGAEDLLEVARQLRTDGARLVVSPHASPGVTTAPHLVTEEAGGAHSPAASRLLSRPEIARHLGVSVNTVDRRVADGSLPHRRLGRRVLFDPAAFTQEPPTCIAS